MTNINKVMIKIIGYDFEGPYYEATTTFNEVGAVYVISDENNNPIDVGETKNLKQRLENHARRACWENSCVSGVYVCAFRIDDEVTRFQVESQIRASYNFTCGVR